MTFKMSTRQLDSVTVLDCSGRLVFGEEASALRDNVKSLLEENSNIVLNLAEVNYIDSGGLGTLVGLYTSAHKVGGNIKLANLTKRVGDLLQVTKLVTVFECYEGVDVAVRSFRGAA